MHTQHFARFPKTSVHDLVSIAQRFGGGHAQNVIDISMVMLMSCLLVCRDLIGDHRKKKRLHGPGCASAKELLQVFAGVTLEKFPTLSDQKAVSKPPPTLLNSRLQSVIIFLLSHVALRNPERRFFLNS